MRFLARLSCIGLFVYLVVVPLEAKHRHTRTFKYVGPPEAAESVRWQQVDCLYVIFCEHKPVTDQRGFDRYIEEVAVKGDN